jgi:hypothetical protein
MSRRPTPNTPNDGAISHRVRISCIWFISKQQPQDFGLNHQGLRIALGSFKSTRIGIIVQDLHR